MSTDKLLGGAKFRAIDSENDRSAQNTSIWLPTLIPSKLNNLRRGSERLEVTAARAAS
jgi:hypothetical protein